MYFVSDEYVLCVFRLAVYVFLLCMLCVLQIGVFKCAGGRGC